MRYGYARGPVDGEYKGVAASLLVHPFGGMWVYLDSSGHVELCIDATTKIYGWACFPTSFRAGSTAMANGYYTSHATAGVDRVYVFTNQNTEFWMPIVSGSSYAVARDGELVDITGVATDDGTPQEANLDGSTHSTNILRVAGGDPDLVNVDRVKVKMNVANLQTS